MVPNWDQDSLPKSEKHKKNFCLMQRDLLSNGKAKCGTKKMEAKYKKKNSGRGNRVQNLVNDFGKKGCTMYICAVNKTQ